MLLESWKQRKQELEEESGRLDEWDKRLEKNKLIIGKIRTLCDILPNNVEQEEIIKDLDALIEKYQQ